MFSVIFYDTIITHVHCRNTRPIVDSHNKVIGVIGGRPKDAQGWEKLQREASDIIEQAQPKMHFGNANMDTRQRDKKKPYKSMTTGILYGGGQQVCCSYFLN